MDASIVNFPIIRIESTQDDAAVTGALQILYFMISACAFVRFMVNNCVYVIMTNDG